MNMMTNGAAHQLEQVLAQIATDATTLAAVARRALGDAGTDNAAHDFHVVQMIAERIGALADLACAPQAQVIGGFGEWVLGPAGAPETSAAA